MAIREFSLKTRLWLQAAMDQWSNWRPSVSSTSEKRRWLELSALEERVFLSASPMGAVAPDSAEMIVPAQQPEADPSTATGDIDPLLAALEVETAGSPDQTAAESRELVIIDAGVRDVDVLLNDLNLASDTGQTIEVIQLDAHRDGVEQISEILASHQNLDAVHVVSHGRDGAVKLGNQWLDIDALQANSGSISVWQQAFAERGDVLFYGCDLAATERGRAFVNAFADLTGTDVAASVDATGTGQWGGDWDLEYRVGSVESGLAFSASIPQDYDQLLATLTVETTNDVLDGDTSSVSALLSNKGADGVISLREAIIAANNTSGADDIFLSAGTYTLALGSGDDNANLGDLDILDDLTITGADAGTTIIDGAGLDRVFHIQNSTMVSMSGLTIRNGYATNNGAGVFVDNSSTLNLTDVILTDNNGAGGDGGAISVRGTLNLNRVLVSNNTADRGAGVYFLGADGGSLINVTFSGNTATSQGGGIWTDSSITIVNSTITANITQVGGGIYQQNGTVALTNTIIAGNTANLSSPDVVGSFSSAGFNLIQDTTGATGFISSDLLGVDPLLNPLSNYGGSIPTHALQSISPAINAGTPMGAPTVDARNVARNDLPDIGAFERIAQHEAINEFRVNSTTTDTQVTSAANRGNPQAVAMSASGDYVVVWSSLNQDGDGWGLYGQRYDRTGTALGAEFLINQTPTGNQQFASVAMNDSGQFVVAWSDDQTGDIHAQRFRSDGTALGGNRLINTTTAGSQTNPSVAIDKNGQFVVVWEGNGPGDSSGVFGQRFQFDGSALGTEFRINTTTLGTETNAAVSMNRSGQFVVSWDDGAHFYAQRFNADGTTNGGEILIQSALLAINGSGDVAVAEDGSFVATWMEDVLIFGKEIYVRRYDAAGNALGSAAVVNTTTSGTQTSPSISMDLAGNFLIVWDGNGSGDADGIFGQKFDAAGNAVGSEFLINQTTTGTQEFASAAMYDLDNFVVVWSGNGVGDADGVSARQFGTATPNTAPSVNIATFSVAENATNGTVIGTITASDPDLGDTLTYSFAGGPAGAFALNSSTGVLTVADNTFLNFEATPTLTLTVSVLDNNLLSDTATVTINLTDANEVPIVNVTPLSIDENSLPGTSVGTITASDPDAGDSYTLAIVGGDPGGFFILNATTGNLQLSGSASLDFETVPQHFLQIQATDAGGLQSVRTIVVQVNDVNESPLLSDVSFDLADNATTGTIVGALNGLDVDAGESLTYAILSGNDAGAFLLSPVTGQLRVADSIPLDRNAMPQFLLTVKVTDAMGLTDTATVTINLVEPSAQPEITNAAFSIDENSPVGTIVGTVSAKDPNGDTPLTYSIDSGNLGGTFEIDANTGEIRVARADLLNFELRSQFFLVVRVTNASEVSNVGIVRVLVNDVSEPPVAVDDYFPAFATRFVFDHEDFLRNDISPEGEKLVVVGFANLGDAQIVDNGDQTYVYLLPQDSARGIYTFTYIVQDESGRMSSAQVTVNLLRGPHEIDNQTKPILNAQILATNPPQRQNPVAPKPQGVRFPNRFAVPAHKPINADSQNEFSPPTLPAANGKLLAPNPGGIHTPRNVEITQPDETSETLPQSSLPDSSELLVVPSLSQPTYSPGLEVYRNDTSDTLSNGDSSSRVTIRNPSNSPSNPDETTQVILQEIGEGSLVWEDLDQLDEAIEAEKDFQVMVVGTAVTVTSTLTIGYVVWMIRGGVLMGSLLTHMPAWRFVDPLPVLEHLTDVDDGSQDQESLESIIDTAGIT